MSFVRINDIKQKTFKDPIDAFQVNDIYRTLLDKLRILTVVVGNEEPEGVVDADIGTIFIFKGATEGKLFFKSSGVRTNTGWVEIT